MWKSFAVEKFVYITLHVLTAMLVYTPAYAMFLVSKSFRDVEKLVEQVSREQVKYFRTFLF